MISLVTLKFLLCFETSPCCTENVFNCCSLFKTNANKYSVITLSLSLYKTILLNLLQKFATLKLS